MKDDAKDNGEEHASEPALDAERYVARMPAGQPRAVRAGDIDRDISAGIRGPDDEHVAWLELSGIPILAGMQLPDRGCECAGKLWHARSLVRRHRDDNMVRLPATVAGLHDIACSIARNAIHFHARVHW